MQPKFSAAVGQRFARLTVEAVFSYKSGRFARRMARCVCDCGNRTDVRIDALNTGRTQSCGCLGIQRIVEYARSGPRLSDERRTQSRMRAKLLKTLTSMIHRCTVPTDSAFPNYGGRGIVVCEQWQVSPEAFIEWSLTHGWRDDLTIDRIDNDGPYAPENCRWATVVEQQRNRRSNRPVTAWGETKCLKEWTEDPRCCVAQGVLAKRLDDGEQPEKAMARQAGIFREGFTPKPSHPRYISAWGESKHVAAWSRDLRCVVSLAALQKRLSYGWDSEAAISSPLRR